MSPLMFQDNLLESSPGITEARAANIRVNKMLKEKRLSLNEDKSVCLVWGSALQKKEVKEELDKKPLKCAEVTSMTSGWATTYTAPA